MRWSNATHISPDRGHPHDPAKQNTQKIIESGTCEEAALLDKT